ncbi:MAG: hypothetical protein HWE16_02940 [Gammaproteobacteria bacterium]|nr:hypothetical protein [Gammaproteobacteria bacterium]
MLKLSQISADTAQSHLKSLILITFSFLLFSCDINSVLNKEDQNVKFYSEQYQITVPGNWSKLNLHDDADLQYGNLRKEAYMIIFTEPKMDFEDGFTLQDYTDLTFSSIKDSLQNVSLGKVTKSKSNGYQVTKSPITGVIDGVKIQYLHTTTEDADNFHQIIFWSLPSKFESNRKKFEKALASFKKN